MSFEYLASVQMTKCVTLPKDLNGTTTYKHAVTLETSVEINK
jgi:hypothetical protein